MGKVLSTLHATFDASMVSSSSASSALQLVEVVEVNPLNFTDTSNNSLALGQLQFTCDNHRRLLNQGDVLSPDNQGSQEGHNLSGSWSADIYLDTGATEQQTFDVKIEPHSSTNESDPTPIIIPIQASALDAEQRRCADFERAPTKSLKERRCSMNAFQVVTEKVAKGIKLTAGFLAQAAAGLVNKAQTLSVEELSRRFDGALRALRGGYLSTSSATTSAAGGRFETVDGYYAVAGKITVNGQQLDTLLSPGSFNKSRLEQIQYAKKLGYRMATHKEHLAYVKGLLEKEINRAEARALNIYRENWVRDAQGGLDVVGWRIGPCGTFLWFVYDWPYNAALFVRASAESK